MKAFEEWQKKRAIKTIGFLTNLAAYKFGEKEGWREALKWVKKHHVELGIDDWTIIEQELEDSE